MSSQTATTAGWWATRVSGDIETARTFLLWDPGPTRALDIKWLLARTRQLVGDLASNNAGVTVRGVDSSRAWRVSVPEDAVANSNRRKMNSNITGHREESVEQPGRIQPSRFSWVWFTLLVVAVLAVGVLMALWLIAQPKPNELTYELAKTCMQIIGITVIGGVLTAATSSVQQARQEDAAALERQRQEDAQALERQRQEDAKALERQREDFKVRTSLLDRSSRCAQEMFATCQHVRRVKTDAVEDDPEGAAVTKARELLDRAYLEFSTESLAIETELGARYGELWVKGDGKGEAFLRWHQVRDLLTLYYFALTERFRGKVLLRNSDGYESKMHSGVNFAPMVADPDRPGEQEVARVIQKIRTVFWESMPKLAEAVLRDTIRDL